MDPKHLAEISSLIGDPSRVIVNPQIVEQLSRDFYWYSPVLRKQLDGKLGEVVVQPLLAAEIQKLLRYCYANDLPVTARGAGTGNYGQAVPLEGGVVLDLSRMDRIEEVQAEGVAVCQPGVRLGDLENEARQAGWELRCYPSTIIKASVGGFLGGGSGGIGTVAHGMLRDFQTVRAIEVVTMEPEPRVVLQEGESVHEILHAWGTNGIITRIWLALTPAVDWSQCVVAFDTFGAAFDFSEKIATGDRWIKRLVTVFEWPIPSFFTPIQHYAPEGKTLIFFMIDSTQLAELQAATRDAGGTVTQSGVYPGLNARPLLSDYTWNHTTLWAMRSDEAYTYLQCGFDPDTVREQMRQLRERFGQEFLFHMEFMKRGDGRVFPGAIPVVYYTTEERLNEMIDCCREIGVWVANPHVNNVEGGGRYRADNVQLLAKRRYDPKGLLNPGKMVTFHSESATAGATTK
ncbi:MAG TPA: FAD-binding oxidoreductase [Candidatus Acidoferrales bacterium]|jgi:FAD/FMN-containing dehydrogenase|nr:FAD-binding oxidoreductase [Candidatus Acidoferrales bacterium]